jgi:methionyl-tRNA formyltransferase
MTAMSENSESNLRVLRPTAAGRIVFVGAVHEARPAFDALLSCRAASVELVVTTPPGSELSGAVDLATRARAAGIDVLATRDINSSDTVAAIRHHDPDLIVVVGWTRLLSSALLAVPRRGCVGFHASLLPRYRGRAPVNWAILRGETVTGNTMMMLDPGVDTGDIVDQRTVPIGPDDTCASVYEKVATAGAQMLLRHLPALLEGTAPRRQQPDDGGEILPRRVPEMGVIDWTRSDAELHDWVRALTFPYPGAFTSHHGRRLMVWRTRPPDGMCAPAPQGTLLCVESDGVRVATGRGALLVTELSSPGAAPRPAAAWCAAHEVGEGTRFDPVPRALADWALGRGPQPAVEETPR